MAAFLIEHIPIYSRSFYLNAVTFTEYLGIVYINAISFLFLVGDRLVYYDYLIIFSSFTALICCIIF
jgi:hypothetical protein